MKKIITIAATIFLLSVFSFGQKTPQFKDYAVSISFSGKNAPLVITKDNRDYRTRLREAAKEKPNFAGRYILAIWGCGTSCLAGAVINAKTGNVTFLPGATYGWEGDDSPEPIEYRLNSRLIIFSGNIDQKGLDSSGLNSHYYEFKNGKFIYLKTIRRKSTN